MELRLVERDGKQFLEGSPGESLLRQVGDAGQIVEACLAHRANRLLLYAENLTERFFDLSSREAGEILQKPQYQAATITSGWRWSGRQKSDN
jgi:hypothetical protein